MTALLQNNAVLILNSSSVMSKMIVYQILILAAQLMNLNALTKQQETLFADRMNFVALMEQSNGAPMLRMIKVQRESVDQLLRLAVMSSTTMKYGALMKVSVSQ